MTVLWGRGVCVVGVWGSVCESRCKLCVSRAIKDSCQWCESCCWCSHLLMESLYCCMSNSVSVNILTLVSLGCHDHVTHKYLGRRKKLPSFSSFVCFFFSPSCTTDALGYSDIIQFRGTPEEAKKQRSTRIARSCWFVEYYIKSCLSLIEGFKPLPTSPPSTVTPPTFKAEWQESCHKFAMNPPLHSSLICQMQGGVTLTILKVSLFADWSQMTLLHLLHTLASLSVSDGSLQSLSYASAGLAGVGRWQN